MMPQLPPTPRWFTILVTIMALPVFQVPVLLANCAPQSAVRTMVWVYLFYVPVAAYLAYLCYPERRALAWILTLLMLLSHIAVWLLVTTTLTPTIL